MVSGRSSVAEQVRFFSPPEPGRKKIVGSGSGNKIQFSINTIFLMKLFSFTSGLTEEAA